jgi:ABC-type sugar transport system permease subunit
VTSPTPPQAPPPALGWLLAVPALFGALISLVLPTGQTIWLSFQSGGVLREISYVGTANYAELLGDTAFWRALWFTLSLTLVPLLVAVVVAPLLALALDRAGTWPRRAGRITLSLAIVTFSPVGVAAAWMRGLTPNASGLAALAEGLRDPATAPGTLRLIVAAATFGVVCALAVIAFLPALRGDRPMPGMFAVGGLVALATVAVGLQTFSMGLVLTQGGPERSTETLASLQYHFAFRMAEFGPGAAVAALTGVILGALGVVATIIAVAARLRIILVPRAAASGPAPDSAPGFGAATFPGPFAGGSPGHAADPFAARSPGPVHDPFAGPVPGAAPDPFAGAAPGSPPGAASGGSHGFSPDASQGVSPGVSPGVSSGVAVERPAGPVGTAVGVTALVVVLAAALLCAWPWIDGLLALPDTSAGGLRAQLNTWPPAVAGALVSVGVAYLAALGIGGLRPLGRGSEWLLLLFAPWLFVGTGPLGVANWQNIRSLGLIDTFAALFPPLLVSVPALLVLTLLCKGLAERTGKDFFSGVFLPSLPMAGVLAGAVTLMNAQDLLWPLLVAQKPGLFTAPVAQVAQLSDFTASAPDVGAATPLLVVGLGLVAVVAAQVFYLDKLALTTTGTTAGPANGSRSRTPAA